MTDLRCCKIADELGKDLSKDAIMSVHHGLRSPNDPIRVVRVYPLQAPQLRSTNRLMRGGEIHHEAAAAG